MRDLFQKHPAVVVTIVLHVLLGAAGLGYFQAHFSALSEKVREFDGRSGDSRETRWIVDGHTRDIGEMKQELRRQGDSIAEIRTDVKLIAAWVRQQQEREARAEGH